VYAKQRTGKRHDRYVNDSCVYVKRPTYIRKETY